MPGEFPSGVAPMGLNATAAATPLTNLEHPAWCRNTPLDDAANCATCAATCTREPTSCADYREMVYPPGCAAACPDEVKRSYEVNMPDAPCGLPAAPPSLEWPSGIASGVGGSSVPPGLEYPSGIPLAGASTASSSEFPSGLPPIGLNSTAAAAPTAESPSGVFGTEPPSGVLGTEPPSGVSAVVPSGASCKAFCDDDSEHSWTEKCSWPKWCGGCTACEVAPPAPEQGGGGGGGGGAGTASAPCMTFCADNDTPWDIKCTWSTICSGCDTCSGGSAPAPEAPMPTSPSEDPAATSPPSTSPAPTIRIGGSNRIEPWHEVEPWPRKDDPPSPPPLDSTCAQRALTVEVNACWMIKPDEVPAGQTCASFYMPKGSQGDWSYCEAMTVVAAALGDAGASKCQMGAMTYGACDGSQASSDDNNLELQP